MSRQPERLGNISQLFSGRCPYRREPPPRSWTHAYSSYIIDCRLHDLELNVIRLQFQDRIRHSPRHAEYFLCTEWITAIGNHICRHHPPYSFDARTTGLSPPSDPDYEFDEETQSGPDANTHSTDSNTIPATHGAPPASLSRNSASLGTEPPRYAAG